jgi:hypothetical protein
MNAVTSWQPVTLQGETDPQQTRAEARERTRTGLGMRPLAVVLTAFWTYVALSNVLYARGMSLALDPRGTRHFFAAWDARVLQHLFLYPILLGCVWASLRVGWRPIWRAVPVQVLLGLAFAVLADPLLSCAEHLVSHPLPMMSAHDGMGGAGHMRAGWKDDHSDAPVWIASATSFLLTYGFALALVMGFALYHRFKESELRLAMLERAWSGARLAALRMQLSPHTLFNLLHTIRGQIAWDPPAAQQMVVQLGDLLRRLLAAGERDLAPLADELEFVRLYLELQRQRFADRLSLDLPDASSLPRSWVPSLILQPLVENAVAHGLADHAGPVVIRMQAAVVGESLILRVTNSIAPHRTGTRDERTQSSRGRNGIGLRNVRERLAVHFGERARFEAGPSRDAEWIAELRMPLVGAPG